MSIISGVCDPFMTIGVESSIKPKSIPARASSPPNPLTPSPSSPVVHCILPRAYRNIANDLHPSVASTHWNVFVYGNYSTYDNKLIQQVKVLQ